MDELLSDYGSARRTLVGNFIKRSRIAVAYMCFERAEVIRRSLPAVMRSDGVENFDIFISQDGGAGYAIDKDVHFPESARIAYIRHRANLCTGLHHHFVKAFAFDIMGYDGLIVVEEDNVVHPQALQLLARMIDLSVDQPDVGIASLLDMDNSAFLDAAKFAVGINPVNGSMGHLWVYGFHKSRYTAVRQDLYDYFNTIKGQDYRLKHEPPLSDKIKALMASKGFPADGELSQDRYFIYSLAKRGFKRRYQTLFRFFEPIGYLGLHHRHTEAQFFAVFGRGMFNGRIRPEDAFDVTTEPVNLELIKAGVRERINRVWRRYFPADVHEPLVVNTFNSLMEGRLNGVEAMTDIRNAGIKATAGSRLGQ
ncbi:hypothetical protein VOLCADRAFT_100403 [Volvox carteri f. nagariensis]|uniref:Uncharacterized protein n=1 Tax=Volvox carteri f. nagariensis TaxID=3068 RepID=D8UK46_VOLCA|nr:uncharacterized protein VOLCADRAFT_100403 [Volvox carteri f. nagariensis]EFJ39889.1 hypothetical protein VOLCADRAFT_100403 [Volvox carteri f. nagariensis]|eukprot:XP_002959028.1 hypothetical protein VOLCADRAFT_100403 [Volvox carteri f. nagariensis]